MSESKIRWDSYGSMHFGYLSGTKTGEFSYIIQGPDRGMYTLYKFTGSNTLKIKEFGDLETAQLAAEEMEESKC